MSLKTKIAILFSSLVTIILLVNNTLFYFYTRGILIRDQQYNMELLSYSIRDSINLSKQGAQYIEDTMGEKLRISSLYAKSKLNPNIENVSNQQLVDLSKEMGISHITLFKEVGNDIVGLKSSDPLEINLSTKDWGYWFTAFQQLFASKEVTIPEGQKLPNYWSGPFDVSTSDQGSIDKWGYYYDGTTNYIINPYIKNDQLYKKFVETTGPQAIVSKTLANQKFLLEITGFNPNTFGKDPLTRDHNGVEIIELSNRPIYFGTYEFKDQQKDFHAIQEAIDSNKTISIITTINNKHVIKSFLPVTTLPYPYVIGLVTDYAVVQDVLNEQLRSNIIISFIILIFVYLCSYFFARYMVKPIHIILNKVDEIAQGQFGTLLKIERKDELGLLSDHVNSMSINLDNYTKQLHEKNDEIKYLAYHDSLTNLPNRRLLNELFDTYISKAEKANESIAVMFLDLDRFKYVNDMYGHATGDLLLKATAERLHTCLDPQDSLYRISGDEFTIVLANATHEKIKEISQGILNQFSSSFTIQGHEFFITSSIGISVYPADGENIETLLKNADTAMYRAKEKGRNSYHYYTSDMHENLLRKLKLEKDMRTALEQEDFKLYYQPQIDLDSKQLIGAEALLRWEHPKFGFVSPAEFIPLAEESGLILDLGTWVLRKACEQNKIWQKQGYPPITMSVNLSPVQFQQAKLIEIVSEVLRDTGVAPAYLNLEITESVSMQNEGHVISKLNSLRELGVQISIDDFGIGYSSLSYLRKYPINSLKIDKSFIDNISIDVDNEKIVKTIIAMAHELQLNVVAEGIENEKQVTFLKDLNCNYGQGYYFSKPIPSEQFESLYNQKLKSVRSSGL